MTPDLIVITGPTATGKTALSVEVAKRLGGEIISCDSMQIYRGMDIGTAKVTPLEQQGVPHYLVDVVDPNDNYSTARYQVDARAVIADIQARGLVPILVGGTGLYVDSVLYPMQFRTFDPAIRDRVDKMLEERGKQGLYDYLQAIDPDTASRLYPNDVKRVSRAIEIALSGQSHSTNDRAKPLYHAHIYVLSGDRQEIYDRIDQRVDRMIEKGLIQEVKALIDSGVDPHCQAFQAIAYKETVDYIEGQTGLDETIALIKKRSRNYAKRQLTWMRRYDAVWLNYKQQNVESIVQNYIHPEGYVTNHEVIS